MGTKLAALVVLAMLLSAAPAPAASTIAVQPDGGTIVGGATELGFGYVARLEANSALSPGFGVGGVLVDHRLGPVSAVAVQPDGKILAAGSGGLARYEPDGDVDTGFGDSGVAILSPAPGDWAPSRPYSVLVLADGRIAVGSTYRAKFQPTSGFVFVFAADGRPEWAATTGTGVALSSLLARADGSLVMVGNEEFGTRGVLARFLPPGGGGPDPSFGAGAGLVKFSPVPDPSTQVTANGIAAVGDDLIVAGGVDGQLLLARFGGQGALDKGFGSEGFALFGGAGIGAASALAVQPDGGMVAVGDGPLYTTEPCPLSCRAPFVARLSPAGVLDGGFGQAGIARLPDLGGAAVNARGEAVALLADGKIMVGGPLADESGDFVLARLKADGAADGGFGGGGVARVAPCADRPELLRRRTCLPSARVRLRVHHSRGRASLRLRVSPAEDWAQIRSVRLHLPRSLRMPKGAAKLEFAYVDREGKSRTSPAGIRPHNVGLRIPRAWGGSVVSLALPAGVLRSVHPVAPLRPRSFKVTVRFGVRFDEAGEQTLVVRRPG